MKKLVLVCIALASFSTYVIAGGIVTNTNQSAAYARLLNRNACLGLDAVYFNPAGLTKLNKGFFFSLNNQTIFQTNTITSSYPYLHGAPSAEYEGQISAPLFPGIYVGYRFGKFAVSAGFNPIGGGGGATYDKGLPSFEIPIANLVPSLAQYGVTDYQADISFEGTSVYFGYQAGLSYEIIPEVSVYAGARYVTVKNTYKGHIHDIMVNPQMAQGAFMRADAFGTEMATYYTGVAASYNNAATGAGQLADAGLAEVTFAQAQAGGYITVEQQAQFEGALQAVGQPVDTPIGVAEQVYIATATTATGGAAQMTGLAQQTGDKEVDCEQTGTGWTPILGANLTLFEDLTVSLRYEFFTPITITNETAVDDTGEFPDGEESGSDMPAMLAVGLSYPVAEKLRLYSDFNYYWDNKADYGKQDAEGNYIDNSTLVDNNMWEIGAGLEYNITEKILVSAGYLYSKSGTNDDYQSDLSYSLSSNAVGFGGGWQITEKFGLNIGVMLAMYEDDAVDSMYPLGDLMVPYTTTYGKFTQAYAIGFDFNFGK
jgi:long-subunit fatty acid transport protein